MNVYTIVSVFKVFKKNYKDIPLEIFGDDPYKALVSTLMSARTNDDTTLEAAKRLFKRAPDFKSLGQLPARNASHSDAGGEISIEKLIYPVGFYKTKAKHLGMLARIILTRYGGRVPKTREELMTLPGVGRKTANLVLNRAFGIPAIAVDTHVHKISNMLGWVHTKTPEQTEKELIRILPKKYWPETNKLFVSIGRQYTTKKRLERFLKENNLY